MTAGALSAFLPDGVGGGLIEAATASASRVSTTSALSSAKKPKR
jgi:hypothetical protein